LYCLGQSSKKGSLEVLYKLQKRSVRVISSAYYRAHTKPLFRKLNILNIYYLCQIQIATFIYKSINHQLPCHCTNYFTRTNDLHSHATRGHEYDLYIVKAHKTCRANSLTSRGPKYWKTLPDFIRSATSLAIFKSRLKEHLLTLDSP